MRSSSCPADKEIDKAFGRSSRILIGCHLHFPHELTSIANSAWYCTPLKIVSARLDFLQSSEVRLLAVVAAVSSCWPVFLNPLLPARLGSRCGNPAKPALLLGIALGRKPFNTERELAQRPHSCIRQSINTLEGGWASGKQSVYTGQGHSRYS